VDAMAVTSWGLIDMVQLAVVAIQSGFVAGDSYGYGKKRECERWWRGTIWIVVGNYWWLGWAIRLGLALNTLIQNFILCYVFRAMVVDVKVFTIEKQN
jgi:hypothetical protein